MLPRLTWPRRFSCLALAYAALTATLATAGELKVDINRDSKNLDSATETGYTKWSADTTGGAATGTNAVTKSFTTASGESVTISFSQTALSSSRGGTGLLSNWYQTGAQGTAKLVSDGITVAPANLSTGGEIQMTITGLSPGHHSLLTYHNAWDALAAGSLSPIDVFVNGTLVVDNLQPTIRAATTPLAPISYVEFDVTATSDITTLRFSADTASGSYAIRNVMINGFELDTPNSTRIANTPTPTDADEHIDADSGNFTLGWAAATAGNAVSHDVYFGSDFTSVKTATRASPLYKGNQSALTYPVSGLDSFLTYYWRIDEIDANGNTTQGTVWSFRTRHLAFPGAEGYGRFARGGRGGKVVHVTSLADYTTAQSPIPGTFRYAVEKETGPRTVVFDVSGLITLESKVIINSPYLTIAGQTAPGKGICFKKYTVGLSGALDAIIRHIRSRPGRTLEQITVNTYKNGTTGAPITADAAVAVDGMGLQGCFHCIIDHCSISWTIDESFSSRSAKNITLQRTLISEALNKAKHPNYIFLDDLAGTEHGYAASIGGDIGSFHHNLLAHCYGRNWSMAGGLDAAAAFAGRLDISNNVVYNWGSRTTDGGAKEVNFVGNFYKPGAGTTLVPYALTANHEDNFAGAQQYYFAGNVMPGYFDESNQATGRRSVVSSGIPTPTYETFVAAPFFPSYITAQTASAAYKTILSDVGCNQPRIDDHDTRVLRETRDNTYTYVGSVTGKAGFPDVETDVGGWENYPEVRRASDWDSDGDGLPDWWETAKGLNPRSSAGDTSDANGDPDGDRYTNLEDYLNWLAAPHGIVERTGSLDIDLTAYTGGFTASPSFSVSAAQNGTLQLLGDGHTARFSATGPAPGLGSFSFTVTDSTGASLTQLFGLRILESLTPRMIVTRPAATLQVDYGFYPGQRCKLQFSSDLLNWSDIAGTENIFEHPEDLKTYTAPANLQTGPRLFFRAVAAP